MPRELRPEFILFFGSVTGLLIGATNVEAGAALGIGIGVGVLLCLLEVLVSHSAFSFVNILFWIFTSRFVARGLWYRIHQPVS